MNEYDLFNGNVVYLSEIDIMSLFLESSITYEQLKKYKNAGKLIGNANWTIPEFMPISFLEEIVDEKMSLEGINKKFLDSFIKNDEEEIKALFESLQKDFDKKYQSVFEEIYFVYENQCYNACAALLFAVIDGVVRDFNGYDKDGVNVEGKKVTKNAPYNVPTIYAHLKSVNVFLNKYFAGNITPTSNVIKRNVLLHGESFEADKVTCIRLLNCIRSILNIRTMVDNCGFY